jgi:menaquinone-9 beta-reductase
MVDAVGKPSYDSDVIIAGAGPAGAAAAVNLTRLGASVILLDCMTFPRDKVCGDFVGPSALFELDALGVCRWTALHRRILAAAAQFMSRVRSLSPGLSARNAGARMMGGCQLTSCVVNSDAVAVNVTGSNGRIALRCRLLIGADGGSSRVARLMSRGATGSSPHEPTSPT